jgi:uncharacterized protein YxjI
VAGFIYAPFVSNDYLISRQWALTSKFEITDEAGVPRYEVQSEFSLTRKMVIRDESGRDRALIARHGLGARHEITADGKLTTVRPRGFLRSWYEIDSEAMGRLEAHGNISGRLYDVTRADAVVAAVRQVRSLREKYEVDIADGGDPVVLLAAILVIELIRGDRRARPRAPPPPPQPGNAGLLRW